MKGMRDIYFPKRFAFWTPQRYGFEHIDNMNQQVHYATIVLNAGNIDIQATNEGELPSITSSILVYSCSKRRARRIRDKIQNQLKTEVTDIAVHLTNTPELNHILHKFRKYTPQINVTVSVPNPTDATHDIKMLAGTDEGEVSLSGLRKGDFTLRATGAIDIANTGGTIAASTRDSISVDEHIGGNLTLRTIEEGIVIEKVTESVINAQSSKGDIELVSVYASTIETQTTQGNHTFDNVTGNISASTDEGCINGDYLIAHGELSSTNGSIKLTNSGLTGRTVFRTITGTMVLSFMNPVNELGIEVCAEGKAIDPELFESQSTAEEKVLLPGVAECITIPGGGNIFEVHDTSKEFSLILTPHR